jgi:CRP-like cAMP-binding protein
MFNLVETNKWNLKMHDQLLNVFNKIVQLSDHEWEKIKNSFVYKEVPAKHFLVSMGEIESKSYFVLKGIVRLFRLNPKSEEGTIFLFKENLSCSSYESFLTENPSQQALETLEPCSLLYIEKEDLDKLYHTVPKMQVIARVVAEQRFLNSQRIFSSHIMLTPEQRYLQFEKMHGNLLLRVPQHIIASFSWLLELFGRRVHLSLLQFQIH